MFSIKKIKNQIKTPDGYDVISYDTITDTVFLDDTMTNTLTTKLSSIDKSISDINGDINSANSKIAKNKNDIESANAAIGLNTNEIKGIHTQVDTLLTAVSDMRNYSASNPYIVGYLSDETPIYRKYITKGFSLGTGTSEYSFEMETTFGTLLSYDICLVNNDTGVAYPLPYFENFEVKTYIRSITRDGKINFVNKADWTGGKGYTLRVILYYVM